MQSQKTSQKIAIKKIRFFDLQNTFFKNKIILTSLNFKPHNFLILDGNIEALISAVESRRIGAIERARGGAGWFGFQQALRGILGTLFWRKSLRATKRPELTFWNKISTGSPWNLRRSSLAEKFAHGEKTSDDFFEKYSPGVTGEKAGVRRPLATLEKTG